MNNPLTASEIRALEEKQYLTTEEFIALGCERVKRLISAEIAC